MAVTTLNELFLTVVEHDKPDCLLHKVGDRYVPISTSEFVDRVHALAAALRARGVERGDRVALMAENGPHWPTVDFATLAIGAILVPIYPTLTEEQAAYIVRDSGAKVIFAQGPERLHGLLGLKDDLPHAEGFVLIEAGASPGQGYTTLEGLLSEGEDADREEIEAEARKATPEDLATFIYTSGTTGNPKGVMLSHGNIASNVDASLQMMDIDHDFTALSFLPLSHSFERTVDYIYFYKGVTVAYAESVQAVAQNIQEVRPHLFVSVPRVYEKILAKIYEKMSHESALKQKLFDWAVEVGKESIDHRLAGTSPSGLLGLELKLADALVFKKIRDRLGGRFEFAMSGGAPLSKDLAQFFWGAGVKIFEGYGLTETSPVLTVNSPDKVRLGTVGTAVPGIELRIADDGEILAKGPNIMKGYYNNPEATAETIDSDGWFHTGDIGAIDEDGFLSITDRKKEIIVNAYGKNVAPAPIENALKASRFIGQVVIIGDKRKFLSALVVPDLEALRAWARSKEIPFTDDEELVGHEMVQALYDEEVERTNKTLAKYEQIHAFHLLSEDFTIEGGELTPTQKVKRRVVHDKYEEEIDRMYERADAKARSSD